jgi:hypothetical protein
MSKNNVLSNGPSNYRYPHKLPQFLHRNRTIDVNIKGVLYGIAAALPYMKRQKSGHIINVSSVAGHHKVRPGSVVYAATKSAVLVISEGLRQEVKPYNIRTTVISPGAVATELPNSVTEPDIAKNIEKFYQEFALPADSCSAFTHVMACTLAGSPCDPFHRKLRQLRCLPCRFDCYRVERTSSRAGVARCIPTPFHGALLRQQPF